jgi:hypothetical protein
MNVGETGLEHSMMQLEDGLFFVEAGSFSEAAAELAQRF